MAGKVLGVMALEILMASTSLAQSIGDHVRLQSSMPAGVPVHANAGELSFFRLPNGEPGTVTAVDPATGWFHIAFSDMGGWVVKKYLVVTAGGGSTGDTGQPPSTFQLVVAGFNTESPNIQGSDPTDPNVVAKHITDNPDVDVWGFAEVLNQAWVEKFTAAAKAGRPGGDFRGVMGTTGAGDRLAIIYDHSKVPAGPPLELITLVQPTCGNKSKDRFRAPLAVPLQIGTRQVLFMVNHLQRNDDPYRHCQAKQLNAWARKSENATTPAIAVGDYNFDVEVSNPEQRDVGFDSMIENGAWKWVQPNPLVKSECSPQFDQVLDFVFVAGPAQQFAAESEILKTGSSYCTTSSQKKESDHRPVKARFAVPQ